jgi:hypothetical protein
MGTAIGKNIFLFTVPIGSGINREHLSAECEVAKNMFASQQSERPSSVAEVYVKLSKMPSTFPDLMACYQLVLTLPVTSASAERSFSTVRRIKSYLRASMGDARLSDLAVIAVERDKSEKLIKNPASIIDEFATAQTKRIDLIL